MQALGKRNMNGNLVTNIQLPFSGGILTLAGETCGQLYKNKHFSHIQDRIKNLATNSEIWMLKQKR